MLFLASAQAVNAFSISPSKVLSTIDPGKKQIISININNTEKKALNFNLKVLGAKQDDQGSPFFRKNIDVAEQWVKPEVEGVYIPSGQIQKVNFHIQVPKNTQAGSHYLALAIEPDSGNGLTGQIICLLTLQVSGMVNESVEITKWETKQNFTKNLNWQFELGLENNGSVEVDLDGNILIKDWRGNEILQKKVRLGNKLLAQSIRSVQKEIKMENLSFPGLYQVQIKIDYGITKQTISSLIYIWYFPKWSWFTGAGILIIFSLIFILFLRAIIRKCKRRKV